MLKFLKNLFTREKNTPSIEIKATLGVNKTPNQSRDMFKREKNTPSIEIKAALAVNKTSNQSREMLKEATALKKEKKYEEACEKLREAYSANGSEDLMVKELLRLPMYLQLAKKNDEGWRILNEMNIKHTDVFSQAEIANQMRVFLQKEKKFTHALLFAVWSIFKEFERDRSNIQGCIDLADQMASMNDEYKFLTNEDSKEKVYGHTKKGNPIKDSTYKMFIDRIEDSISVEGVSNRILPLLKKMQKEKDIESLSVSISEYLRASNSYDLRNVRDIINEKLSTEDSFV